MINNVIRVQGELSGIWNDLSMKEGLSPWDFFFPHIFVAAGINLRIRPHLPSCTSSYGCLLHQKPFRREILLLKLSHGYFVMFPERKDTIPLTSSLSPWGSAEVVQMFGNNVGLSTSVEKGRCDQLLLCTLMWNVCSSIACLVLGESGWVLSPNKTLCPGDPRESEKIPQYPSLAQLSLCLQFASFFSLSFMVLPIHITSWSFHVHIPPALLSTFSVSSNDCLC